MNIKNNKNSEKWNSICIGMSSNDVLNTLGNPKYKDQVFVSDKGRKERWVYGKGSRNLNYVYIENDKLVSCTINRIF
jgi:outer membrane protein assembly factor BamE (lipoprotein component of BamABCDE complex)